MYAAEKITPIPTMILIALPLSNLPSIRVAYPTPTMDKIPIQRARSPVRKSVIPLIASLNALVSVLAKTDDGNSKKR